MIAVEESAVLSKDSNRQQIYKELERKLLLLQWSLPIEADGKRLPPARSVVLASERAKDVDGTGATLPPPGFFPHVSAQDRLTHVNPKSGTLSVVQADSAVRQVLKSLKIPTSPKTHGDVLLSRDGNQAIADVDGQPSLIRMENLAVAFRLSGKKGFREWNDAIHGRSLWSRFLTADARYYVAVPFNEAGASTHDHHQAIIYDLNADDVRSIALRLEGGPATIVDAESVGGDLRFLAFASGERLADVDATGKIHAWLPSNGFRFFNFSSNTFWDPAGRRFAVWTFPDVRSLAPVTLTLKDYDGKRDMTFILELPARK